MSQDPAPYDSRPARGRPLIVATLVLALAIVIACAAGLLRSTHEVHRSIAHVQMIGGARLHLDALRRLVVEVENHQRGYLLSGFESRLTAAADASRQAQVELSQLEKSLSIDDAAHAQFAALSEASLAVLNHTRATLDLATRSAATNAEGGVDSGERVRELAAGLEARLGEEEARLADQLLRDARFRSMLILVLLAANVVLVAGIVALAWQFSRMRSVVRIVSRSPTIEHDGEWVTFETYLHRRFGVRATRGLSSAEMEKLSWARTPPGAVCGIRPHGPGRRRPGRMS